ncbi:hypothetical protein DR85_1937 [Francisella tularensis]|nr:hypothetical protein DR85_1937 [Francisella tularensis]
MRNTYAHH